VDKPFKETPETVRMMRLAAKRCLSSERLNYSRAIARANGYICLYGVSEYGHQYWRGVVDILLNDRSTGELTKGLKADV